MSCPHASAGEGRFHWKPWGYYALWVFVALAPLHFFLRGYSLWYGMMGDEGVLLGGAARLLSGQAPHRDFYSILPPGSFALLAGVQWILGPSLLAARFVAWANYLCTVALFSALAHRAGIRRVWVASALPLFLLFYAATWNMVSHHWMACAWVLLSAWLISDATLSSWKAFGGGIAAAAAGLTLQDLGLYWALVAGIALWLTSGEGAFRRAVSFFAGVASLGLPILGSLLWVAGPKAVLEDLVLGPLTRYHTGYLNNEAVGTGLLVAWKTMGAEWRNASGWQAILVALHGSLRGLAELQLVGVYLAAVGVVGLFVVKRRTGLRLPPWPILVALWVAMTGALLHHPAGAGFSWALPASLLLALWGVEKVTSEWQPAKRRAAALVLAIPALFSATLVLAYRAGGTSLEDVALPRATIAPAGELEKKSLEAAKSFRAALYKPGQRVFCYEYNPALYSFLDIPNPYRYDLLVLPMLSRQQQAGFWDEMALHPPDWILWDRQRVGKDDPVFRWIEPRYQVVSISPHLVILSRKELPK